MVRRILLLTLAWLVVALPSAVVVTLSSARETTFAGHEVTVRATLDGWATFDLGPYLPDFRHPSTSRVGVRVDVGKTTAVDYDTIVQRYAVIASAPDSQVDKLRGVVTGIVLRGVLAGSLIGVVAPLLVRLVGKKRWYELARRMTTRKAAALGIAVTTVCTGLYVAFPQSNGPQVEEEQWQPIQDALPTVPIPEEARALQVDRNLMTTGSARLVESLVNSYRSSLGFYTDLRELAEALGPQLHPRAEDETVAVLVSDRHDNIRMDPVARGLADAAGATMLINAGDDTSSGGSWEAFSLESLDHAFDDFEYRYGVAGNHDNGDFVVKTFRKLGFTMLSGEPVDGPDGIRLFGVSDPRSSGLGSWIDEKEVTFSEQSQLIADAVCAEDEAGRRVSALVVHDANSAQLALDRGCVDLVLSGHRHEQVGPDQVIGENGKLGYRYVTGTTGGAAYAIAIGSKLRRNAQVTLVTFRDGRPVGLQPVTFRTVKDIVVGDYVELDLGDAEESGAAPAPRRANSRDR